MEYGARLVVHSPNAGIGRDWNHALSVADTRWVTIAHQDDIYLPTFGAESCAAITRNPNSCLVMTGYGELVDGNPRLLTPMLAIKRLLQKIGFTRREAIASGFAKRNLLRFGCAIPCPSVTLRLTPDAPRFREDLKLNLDWEMWLRLANTPGGFARVRKILMLHRIHAASETSEGIRGGARAREDLMMFKALWPTPIALLLARVYAASYETGSAQ